MKRIVFTVTNDLNYDQRMIRICNSLADAGYDVLLIGHKKWSSTPLLPKKYRQKRLTALFTKGFAFYASYNIRLFFCLLFTKADVLCCIDLDTILPAWLAGRFKKLRLVYDAHEYFSEQKEIITRPGVHKVWKWIEKNYVPKFKNGYTVSYSIAAEFKKLYSVDYEVIRNVPLLTTINPGLQKEEKILLYQGAVNEARGLEFLIPAMQEINAKLHIYGDGNFLNQTKKLIAVNNLKDKVFLKGKVLPEELNAITQEAYIGLNLVEHKGLNQYYSLANKFFDYIHNDLPQVTMNFPEYKKINDAFEVALLIDDLQPVTIADTINKLMQNKPLYIQLKQNCLAAKKELNWQHEETKLIQFYKDLIG